MGRRRVDLWRGARDVRQGGRLRGAGGRGREALTFALYSIDEQGRPRDLFVKAEPGGWQEDAHTDVVHNVVDALRVPGWGG